VMRQLAAKATGFATGKSSPALPSTTFEKRFTSAGLPIHRLALRKVSPVT
jgi:hypothetical protein